MVGKGSLIKGVQATGKGAVRYIRTSKHQLRRFEIKWILTEFFIVFLIGDIQHSGATDERRSPNVQSLSSRDYVHNVDLNKL